MKRRAVFILLLLVAGAIVNIAMAWGCASRASPKAVPTEASQRAIDFAPKVRAPWRTSDRTDDRVRTETRRSFGSRLHTHWMGEASSASEELMGIESVSGWPLPALASAVVRIDPGAIFEPVGLIANKYPAVPLWPGFAINTVFYAVILWGLFAAPFALRRRRRIKRGLCPKCAYPRGVGTNQVCTECGAAVTHRTSIE